MYRFSPKCGSLGFSELVAQAEVAGEAGETSVAIPLLTEIITRAGSLENDDAMKNVQVARLQLTSMKQKNWGEAKKYAEGLANKFRKTKSQP